MPNILIDPKGLADTKNQATLRIIYRCRPVKNH